MRNSSPLFHSLSYWWKTHIGNMKEDLGGCSFFYLSDKYSTIRQMNFMCNQIELYTKNLGKIPICRCQQRNSINVVLHMAFIFPSFHIYFLFASMHLLDMWICKNGANTIHILIKIRLIKNLLIFHCDFIMSNKNAFRIKAFLQLNPIDRISFWCKCFFFKFLHFAIVV